MSPEEESKATQESEDGAAEPVGGERLAAVRRELGVSVRDVAKELHLDEPKIRALEENRFEVLGAPVFAKGHLRTYAELMRVPIDDVISDYYLLNRSAGAPPVVGPPRESRRDTSIGLWIAGIIVILMVATAAWWWMNRKPETEIPIIEPATLAPFESERSIDATQQLADNNSPNGDSGTFELPEQLEIAPHAIDPQVAIDDVLPEPEPDLQMADVAQDGGIGIAEGNVELTLSYSGECWTEVTDATGRRLFYNLGTDGGSVTVSGIEPLRVLLGNSANVSIQVNGFDYRIPTASRRGNMARLSIVGQ